MKNEKITRKESLIFIAFLWVLFLCLNLRVNCEKVRKLNEGEKEEIDNSTIHKCVVIDAGSTGTRVYIYNYKITNDDKEMKIYIPAISYRTTPGLVYILNDYFSNGEEKSFYDYFNNIKSFIYNNVLEEERETTFILLRASGGFRLLSINKSEKYINFVKNYFLKNFNEFLLIDDFLVKVLSGKEEAILSFVSIYALLGKFSPNPLIFTDQGEDDGTIGSVEEESKGESIPLDQDDDSIGVLELGGATAQVIIKIPMSKMNEDILNLFNYQHKENKKKGIIEENYKNKNIVKIHFCNKDIYLYCKSYLVLGRQNAMKTYLHYIVHENSKKDNTMNKYMHVACFPKDFKFYINNLYKTSIEEEIQEYNDNTQLGEYEFVGIGTGDIDLCRTQIQNILTHAQIDILPFKLKKFIKLYGIENFHHFAIDILNLPETHNPILLNTNMYLEKAKEICPLTIDEIRKVVRPDSNIEKAQTSCFGLTFLYEFMRHTLGVDNPILFHSTNYINNTSITWTIAVLLMELPSHLGSIRKRKKENPPHDEL
ncbi:adenosine-diphosphatase, putative [Plasmodium ovale]|uniref:Adenosine-diphosphatase, putative n=1 Tax=Plasmodium ovale TaxID=36330 RepID=A0A1D3TKQ3_PLAOA|nr:adenosine-diphosphatase, putative [Plasmodium ovale]